LPNFLHFPFCVILPVPGYPGIDGAGDAEREDDIPGKEVIRNRDEIKTIIDKADYLWRGSGIIRHNVKKYCITVRKKIMQETLQG
jgi:hypothetical protein